MLVQSSIPLSASLLLQLLHFFLFLPLVSTSSRSLNLDSLSYYEVVEPHHLHTDGTRRSRRDLSTLIENEHLEETAFLITGHNRVFHLQIYKNTFLIPRSYNLITQNNDGQYIYSKKYENCYYHGFLANRESSSAIITTCNGLKGVIKDSDGEEFVIEPHPDEIKANANAPLRHVLYNNRDDLGSNKDNFECGVEDDIVTNSYSLNDGVSSYSNQSIENQDGLNQQTMLEVISPAEHQRSRRSISGTKYIEVVMVIDNNEYSYYHGVNPSTAMKKTEERGLEVMSYVDAYYKTMNTRIVVTNLIIWNVKNLTPVTSNGRETLAGIKAYTKDVLFGEMKLNFDNTQLMIYKNWGSLAGMGTVGIICSPMSAAVSRDITTTYSTANTVAHEMGHNIGFPHYNGRCSCVESPCVMAKSKSESRSKSFAPCTRELYEEKLNKGALPCLLEYPEVFYNPPLCGNGLLEVNETCDCGTENECNSTGAGACCDFATCKLKAGADCAEGGCCEGCKFKAKGVMCRDKLNLDCDIEEYCTGTSHLCPENKFLSDGGACNDDTSYCYQGMCKTHDTACEFLWGEVAKKAVDYCFNPNAEDASTWAGCGKNDTGFYQKCEEKDKMCGKLQCQPKSSNVSFPKFPLLGTYRGKRTKSVCSNSGCIKCIQGKTLVSPDMGDPTIAPDGVKCGNFSICVNNKCVAVNDTGCNPPCKNGGKCSYDKRCVCKEGFLPPICEAAFVSTSSPPTSSLSTSSPTTSSLSLSTPLIVSKLSSLFSSSAATTFPYPSMSSTPFIPFLYASSSSSVLNTMPLISALTIQSTVNTSQMSTISSSVSPIISSPPTSIVTLSSISMSSLITPSSVSKLNFSTTAQLNNSKSHRKSASGNSELYWLFLLLVPVAVIVVVVVLIKFGAVSSVSNSKGTKVAPHEVATHPNEKTPDVEKSIGLNNAPVSSGYEDFPDNNPNLSAVEL